MNCEWNAGHDRYTGTVPAAIAAYHLPLATQQALIEQWERREFADVVTIDRDSIRGRAGDYLPDLRQMNFGSVVRRCDTVTRSAWSPEHVETAVVLCAGGECVAIPSICTNVSRITRIEHPTPVGIAALMPDAAAGPAAGPIDDAPGMLAPGPIAGPLAADNVAGEGWAWSAGGGGYGAGPVLVEACSCCGVPLVPAVPEPSSWALFAAGLGLVVVVARGKA